MRNLNLIKVIICVFLIVMCLYSCESKDISSGAEPSVELIRTDIQKELAEKYPNVKLKDVNIPKSFTDQKKSEANLQFTADSKYAVWTYEAVAFYTQYDQGWMIDKFEWVSSDCEVVKKPTVDEAIDLVASHVPTEITPDSLSYWDELIELDEGELEMGWFGIIENTKIKKATNYTVRLKYKSNKDEWYVAFTDAIKGYTVNEQIEYIEYKNISMSIRADDNTIVNVEDFTIKSEDGTEMCLPDTIAYVLDENNIDYEFVPFAGVVKVERIGDYTTEDNAYIWEAYNNGEIIDGRLATYVLEGGENFEIVRNSFESVITKAVD